jgi:glutathione S-transferase
MLQFTLRYTPIAQYVQSVEAVINYAGLRDSIELVPTRPFDPACDLANVNPLGTVPTLILDDGSSFYGGPVIYEFLDSLHHKQKLYPDSGRARFAALRQCWLADGLFDSIVRIIIESWEPPESQRPKSTARNWAKVTRALDQLDRDAIDWSELHIGQVRAVGAIAFLDLKYPIIFNAAIGLPAGFDWRVGHPRLSDWYDHVAADPIFNRPLQQSA